MKEELLEAIYGTVERLEQKVDELLLHQRTQERKRLLRAVTRPSWRN